MRLLLLCLLVGSSFSAQAQNVLGRRIPSQANGVPGPDRVTNLQSPVDGDGWDGPSAAVMPPGAMIEWDLGNPHTITGAAVQADNNDDYLVYFSDDGEKWREAWRAGPIEGGGLRTRSITAPLGTTRFVRLMATGGDTRYSVSELELFEGDADDSTLLRARWIPRRPVEQTFISWIIAAAVLLMISGRKLPLIPLLGVAALGLCGSAYLVFELTPKTPGALQSLPWIRAAVALVAAAAVIRDRLWRGRWPAHDGFIVGTLGVTGAMAMWCFLNLGTPQFHDATERRGTWLHHYDMRTYFPIAKYFPELRFDGVYAASVLAVADGKNLDLFDNQPLRDLRTHALTNVRDSKAHLLEVRSRFTPQRWAMFMEDMGYFRRAMGDGGFLGSMNDHGGNATPVWFLTARALFASAPASDATLWTGVVADLALLALAFLALGWAFGARTALLAMTVFGAMDFYQFGSNWFGATLRHDWLSLWAIGLALLQKRKLAWAGAAFAWSAWIRAFPALTLITLSFPVVWVGLKLIFQGKRVQALEVIKPLLRVAMGVVIASVVLVGFSIAVFGADAWVEWLHKVQTLDRDNHLNNVAFRTYITNDKQAWVVACVGSLVLLLLTLRRASLPRAAAWGVALIGIVFNPANYYLHSVFLMVTLAGERHTSHGSTVRPRGVLVWLVLLAMCVASYLTNLSNDAGAHFRMETIILFVTLGALWLLELGRPREDVPVAK
ncbi:MAG: discoidin domain-containing protein [Archangium sp.]|nr:discoidin domain-containing protein [Archangium sp.]